MSEEEKIKQRLEEKFSFLKDAVTVKRRNSLFVDVAADKFEEVFSYAVKDMGFDALAAITGLDLNDSFAVLYHLKMNGALMLSLRVAVRRDSPSINTVTTTFQGAEIYEREMMDLLGIEVRGLAKGHRYPLPDTWPKNEFPLRKDWKAHVDTKEAEHA